MLLHLYSTTIDRADERIMRFEKARFSNLMAFLARGGAIDGTPRRRGGVMHDQPGRIPAIASLCLLVFGVGLRRLMVQKTSSAAIKLSAAGPCTVRARRTP